MNIDEFSQFIDRGASDMYPGSFRLSAAAGSGGTGGVPATGAGGAGGGGTFLTFVGRAAHDRFRRRVNLATGLAVERAARDAGLPLPTGVAWGRRRRIYTIPDRATPVDEVIGPIPWPLGTIIRYKSTGNMYRYVGIYKDGRDPWECLGIHLHQSQRPAEICRRAGHVPTTGLRYDLARDCIVADCTRCDAVLTFAQATYPAHP